MKSLASLLEQRQNLSPLWKGVKAALIVDEANQTLSKLFGQAGQRTTKAVYFKNNTLTFACLSSIVAQEIRLNEKNILARLNQKFGENTVKKIRYLA